MAKSIDPSRRAIHPPSDECLTVQRIQALLDDSLSPAEAVVVEEHLSTCNHCRTHLEAEFGEPRWWPVAKDSLSEHCSHESGSRIESPSFADWRQLLGPTDDPNSLGRIGNYEVVGMIGRGGMGVVFKAFDDALHRYVAIKILAPHLASSGAARKRFAREVQAAAAVVDDHVLPIHSVDQWQGIPYFVMQYSRGVTLQKRIQDQGPLELKEILRIGMQTAKGLAAAHAQGLIHRDVKPSNILLDGTVERVLLSDFGLARAIDDVGLTHTGTVAGTPQYMSPEQVRGGNVDARSDLFALGCVLYAMCTARPPFRAANSYAVMRLITDEEPRPIREVNPEIPEWLCRLIARLMAKSPGDRWSSAAEVAALLESCLAHVQQPTATPLPHQLFGMHSRGERKIGRWIAASGVVVIGLAGLLCLVIDLSSRDGGRESDNVQLSPSNQGTAQRSRLRESFSDGDIAASAGQVENLPHLSTPHVQIALALPTINWRQVYIGRATEPRLAQWHQITAEQLQRMHEISQKLVRDATPMNRAIEEKRAQSAIQDLLTTEQDQQLRNEIWLAINATRLRAPATHDQLRLESRQRRQIQEIWQKFEDEIRKNGGWLADGTDSYQHVFEEALAELTEEQRELYFTKLQDPVFDVGYLPGAVLYP
jgi:serine/threonine protein kinase